jgi:hypothetical protein
LIEFRIVDRDGAQIADWQKMTVSGDKFIAAANTRVPLFSWDWLRRHKEAFTEVRVNEAALRSDFAVKELKRDGPDPIIDKDTATTDVRYSSLAVPLLLRESLVTFISILVFALGVIFIITYWGYRYLRKLLYYISDTWIWRQRVTVVVQPAFQDEILRPITNDYRFTWKGPAVKIKVGDESKPDWKPGWLKAKRLFRPWGGEAVVKLRYPVRTGKKAIKHSVILIATTVNQDGPAATLTGVPVNVQAVVRVKRRVKTQ